MRGTDASDANLPEAAAPQRCVVLVEPHHPGNIGAVARALSNTGSTELRLVAPCELTSETRALAWGALERLEAARVFPDLEAAVADCSHVVGFSARDGRYRLPPRSLAEAAPGIAVRPGRTALVFGREDAGLRFEEVERCHELVRIPTPGGHPSLNLAQATMVALYEIEARPTALGEALGAPIGRRGRVYGGDLEAVPVEAPALPSEILERLLGDWESALRTLGYDSFGPPDLVDRTMRRLRRVLFRAGLDREDADMLFGFARRIQGTYRQPGSKGGPSAAS